MNKIKHLIIKVNSDMQDNDSFVGTLNDYACFKLNEQLELIKGLQRVISISEHSFSVEVRPQECNSSTWYNRQHLNLSVYIDVKETEFTDTVEKYQNRLATEFRLIEKLSSYNRNYYYGFDDDILYADSDGDNYTEWYLCDKSDLNKKTMFAESFVSENNKLRVFTNI